MAPPGYTIDVMAEETKIEPVPPGRTKAALDFLVAGEIVDVFSATRAEKLEEYIRSRSGLRTWFWWAKAGKQTSAAAMVVESPGRIGMLLHSPVGPRASEGDALSRTIAAASIAALEDNLAFVQAMMPENSCAAAKAVTDAGFTHLARLVHMTLDAKAHPGEIDQRISWLAGGQYEEKLLEHVISSTYEGSLDCPALTGLRPVSDIIAGHKSSGIFTPQCWWIAHFDGHPSGCLLMNDSSSSEQFCEIVYLGVVPQFRGKGIAKAMIAKASAEALRRGKSKIRLAMDDANIYAKRIYVGCGFATTSVQLAYILKAPPKINRVEQSGC